MNVSIKAKLIQVIEGWDIPESKIEERDNLIKTLRRPDIIITDKKSVDEFLQHSLDYFFRENFELKSTAVKPRGKL
jgi:hypothetical protein